MRNKLHFALSATRRLQRIVRDAGVVHDKKRPRITSFVVDDLYNSVCKQPFFVQGSVEAEGWPISVPQISSAPPVKSALRRARGIYHGANPHIFSPHPISVTEKVQTGLVSTTLRRVRRGHHTRVPFANKMCGIIGTAHLMRNGGHLLGNAGTWMTRIEKGCLHMDYKPQNTVSISFLELFFKERSQRDRPGSLPLCRDERDGEQVQ